MESKGPLYLEIESYLYTKKPSIIKRLYLKIKGFMKGVYAKIK